jgi:hypothetical protein
MVPPLAGIIQKAVAGGAVTFLNAWLKELLPVGWVRYDKRQWRSRVYRDGGSSVRRP